MGIGYGIWRTVNIEPGSDQVLLLVGTFINKLSLVHSLSFPFPSPVPAKLESIIYYNAPIPF